MNDKSNMIWINAGELSGDMHGAWLVKALQRQDPALRFMGMGGARMAEAGVDTLFRVEDLSVMGITEVIGHLPRIFHMLSGIQSALRRLRPKAVVVIDAPDFHFRVIKGAKKLGIPVYYYISPKIWAWREKRAEFIRDNVRRLLSILPFEVDFYKRFGMDVDYVGNPLVDIVNYRNLRSISRQTGLIGLLPGSRKKEVASLLPEFAGAARLLRRQLPALRFVCVRAPGLTESYLRSFLPGDVPVDIVEPDDRWSFMRQCELILAASGTAILECALAGTPTIVAYKVSPLSAAVAKRLIRVPFVSLPNLILGREVFPELLQERCTAASLAERALPWLLSGPASPIMEGIQADLQDIRSRLGEPGAPDRAAKIILDDLAALPGGSL